MEGENGTDGWTPESVCQFADDFAEKRNEQLTEVVLFGLSLIAVASQFGIDLGKGWQNYKQMAKGAGLEYEFKDD